MAASADDTSQEEGLARAIAQLSPEEAQFFLDRLERAIRKRKIQLTGYLVGMIVWFIGMVGALYVYGSSAEGSFVGWVFIVPFAFVAIVLILFGRWAERAGAAPDGPTVAMPPQEPRSGEIVSKPPPDAKPAE